MNMLRRIDVEGVQDRLHNRLTRRCYAAKVRKFLNIKILLKYYEDIMNNAGTKFCLAH